MGHECLIIGLFRHVNLDRSRLRLKGTVRKLLSISNPEKVKKDKVLGRYPGVYPQIHDQISPNGTWIHSFFRILNGVLVLRFRQDNDGSFLDFTVFYIFIFIFRVWWNSAFSILSLWNSNVSSSSLRPSRNFRNMVVLLYPFITYRLFGSQFLTFNARLYFIKGDYKSLSWEVQNRFGYWWVNF